ncbi:MAG TPA: dihydrodipicolinate synthase family protein [Bryobacteraceae bacterium]|nr:dihydrodipicolinate synthase family protein [Bryobacteraceae bacterium]
MVYIAAITPRGGQGEIDAGAVFELIDYLCKPLKGHAGAIVLFDAAGEYPALHPDDRSRVLRLAVKRSRVPVLAGVGSATLDLSLKLAREARDAGAEALVLPPPYFYPYRQDEVREFYFHFSAHLGGCPIYLEHLPMFTTGIAAETARELISSGRFAGIVDTTREHSGALVADDRRFLEARCAGQPVVSAAACAIPELVVALDSSLTANRGEEACRLNARLHDFLAWADCFPPFALFRIATGLRGIKTGPPAMPMPPDKQQKMDEFREWFKSGDWK